jgi:chemotaxis family two-component system response regulator PixG
MNSNIKNLKTLELNKIVEQFNTCYQQKYNGKVTLKNSQGKAWNFYYRTGQLVWATGGHHPHRRLQRNIQQFCPQIQLPKLELYGNETNLDYWDYCCLKNLSKSQKIKQEAINNIAVNITSEVLFDLAHHINYGVMSVERYPEDIADALIISPQANVLLQQMQELWHSWSEAGLTNISPQLAPIIRQPGTLRQTVSPVVYQNFEKLINGKHTLWDLAVHLKQTVLQITRSLFPYIQKGIIELIEVSDSVLPITKVAKTLTVTTASKGKCNIPMVTCLDDSPQVCKMLEQIITSQGMRFVGLTNPVQAIPFLIQTKPDLILLDLMMPVVNGYEVCSQIRKSSVLANTPIVILTGSSGVFDHVRSKVFGATDFISKPICKDQIIQIVNKYLHTDSSSVHHSDLSFCH